MFAFIKNKFINKTSSDGSANWFEERYESIVLQRNLITLFAIICLLAIIATVLAVMKISLSKRFDPFVIQIEDKTGATKIVNPIGIDVLNGKTALAQYFIKQYVTARETYNPVDFETRARKVIRLFSTNTIYWQYMSYINRKENDPRLIYAQRETTTLTVRSWSELEQKKFLVRFSVNETVSGKVFNKIAIVEFDYVAMELTSDEKDINPLGFQVKGYRVDDDYS